MEFIEDHVVRSATEGRDSEPEEFRGFYAAQHRRAVGLAYVLCGDRAAAEDLAHEAFVAAFRHWPTLSTEDDPAAWLRRVIANRSASRWRRVGRESAALRRLSARRQPTMQEVGSGADRFWALVRQLPRQQSLAVALFYAEDLSIDDIAPVLGCSPDTVKAHLFKARRRLAEVLGTEPAEER